jgi:hypothetical protein
MRGQRGLVFKKYPRQASGEFVGNQVKLSMSLWKTAVQSSTIPRKCGMIQIFGITFFSTSTSTVRTAAASEHLTRRAGRGWLPIFLSLIKEVFCCETMVRYIHGGYEQTRQTAEALSRALE